MVGPSRRRLLGMGVALGLGSVLAGCDTGSTAGEDDSGRTHTNPNPSNSAPEQQSWRMPDESAPHTRTWMAFGAQDAIWEPSQLPQVRRNLAAIANAIAEFEPVYLLTRSSEMNLAASLVGTGVTRIPGRMDDLWMRDTGPVFVERGKDLAGVSFNFNGWGNH
ncbi:MAG: agmatine deiminase family protein, partial [Sciscionella sp.]